MCSQLMATVQSNLYEGLKHTLFQAPLVLLLKAANVIVLDGSYIKEACTEEDACSLAGKYMLS